MTSPDRIEELEKKLASAQADATEAELEFALRRGRFQKTVAVAASAAVAAAASIVSAATEFEKSVKEMADELTRNHE